LKKTDKLVRGIGTTGTKHPSYIDGKALKPYQVWKDMLFRCTEEYWAKYPSYIGTTCSENFKSYAFFYEWYAEQAGFDNKDVRGHHWHLDKDLLVKGNKVYSEALCVFVPEIINNLLVKCNSTRGLYPIGVYFHKERGNFVAMSKRSGNSKYLGSFSTPTEAFVAYKAAKEVYIKQVAEQYKHQLDPRAYEALVNYQVEETD